MKSYPLQNRLYDAAVGLLLLGMLLGVFLNSKI